MVDARTRGGGESGVARYTDYLVRINTRLPVFKVKEFECRRRYRSVLK